MTTVRPLVDADYPAYLAVHNRVWPDEVLTERELRYGEETWDESRYFKQRLVVEDEAGQPVGFGSVRHMQEQFHPDKYRVGVLVNPVARRRGYGSALHDALNDLLRVRQAISARTYVKESDEESVRFATRRGYVEVRRAWQSKLDVNAFDMERFASAMDRIADEEIVITTLAAETGTRPNLWQEMYELDTICTRDVPDVDPFTPVPYDDFVRTYITAPYVLTDAFFLAKDGDRYVGVARLWSSEGEPDILHQDLTGVIPEYRGKGVALALKLKTVEYARANGKREIRTWNDSLNQPMLRINEAMGFQKSPAEIAFIKDLTANLATTEADRTEGATQ